MKIEIINDNKVLLPYLEDIYQSYYDYYKKYTRPQGLEIISKKKREKSIRKNCYKSVSSITHNQYDVISLKDEKDHIIAFGRFMYIPDIYADDSNVTEMTLLEILKFSCVNISNEEIYSEFITLCERTLGLNIINISVNFKNNELLNVLCDKSYTSLLLTYDDGHNVIFRKDVIPHKVRTHNIL